MLHLDCIWGMCSEIDVLHDVYILVQIETVHFAKLVGGQDCCTLFQFSWTPYYNI